MKCPECGKGDIRVITTVVCLYSEHTPICDNCLSFFAVPHGAWSMPPDVEIILSNPSRYYSQSLKSRIKTDYPLLEDFKASLEAES